VTPTLLQTVLRRAARLTDDPTAPGASDADLLRRFADAHDEAAFQTLLDRHGPLAWAVCRQMLADPADAEDAFQATFLALVQSAGKLGRVKSVGGWLHGVAVKVCLKVRRSAVRRKAREARSAKPEAVPSGPQWDDLHAAVHEEVERLPAALRAVFVLCELEGMRQPDAAAKLGCKLGTLSARLTRARQALLKALTARGLAPTLAVGTVAVGSSAAAVPLMLMEKAILLARGATDAGFAVPSVVFKLAQSVTEGTLMTTKLLVAAGFAAAGLMLTAAGGWADAQGQPPARELTRPAPRPQPPEPPRPPEPPPSPGPTRLYDPPPAHGRQSTPQRVEHLILDMPKMSFTKEELSKADELTKAAVTKLIRVQEMSGWEFAGQVGEGRAAQLVFKRPKGNPLADRGPRGNPNFLPPDAPPAPRARDPFSPPPLDPRRDRVTDPDPRGPRDPFSPPPLDPQPGAGLPGGPGMSGGMPGMPGMPGMSGMGGPGGMPGGMPGMPGMPGGSGMSGMGGPGRPLARQPEVAEIYVLELKHAAPLAMSQHVKGFFPDAIVVVDDATGSLLIRCDNPTLEGIEQLLLRLDKSPRPKTGPLDPPLPKVSR